MGQSLILSNVLKLFFYIYIYYYIKD